VNSGQHESAVARTFGEFGIGCDLVVPQLPPLGSLSASREHLENELRAVIARTAPDIVVVQGDTLTAYAGARTAHDMGLKVAHVEAGLRTERPREPFPEEWFRRRIARFADLHFAPCASATRNLLDEGVPELAIHQTGNTGIDSLRQVLRSLDHEPAPARRTRVLVTLHRRENYDANAAIVCDALVALATARPELSLLFPVHPNPRVACVVRERLSGVRGCRLVDPLSYPEFIREARDAALIISDSGGIQEEAPHLGTPLLVPRVNTERPEGLATGFVRLVHVDAMDIVGEAMQVLDAPRSRPLPIDVHAPYGAGDAAQRITQVIASTHADTAFA
jgi:UDP-N-acetylglucosamine 2-epimerase (non-hydrolysing)